MSYYKYQRPEYQGGVDWSWHKIKYPYCKFIRGYAKVYSLSDKDGNVFYVGCTSQDLKKRLSAHLAEARSSRKDISIEKANKIISLNFDVRINLIEEKYFTGRKLHRITSKMFDREKYWIMEYIKRGVELVNWEYHIKAA